MKQNQLIDKPVYYTVHSILFFHLTIFKEGILFHFVAFPDCHCVKKENCQRGILSQSIIKLLNSFFERKI